MKCPKCYKDVSVLIPANGGGHHCLECEQKSWTRKQRLQMMYWNVVYSLDVFGWFTER